MSLMSLMSLTSLMSLILPISSLALLSRSFKQAQKAGEATHVYITAWVQAKLKIICVICAIRVRTYVS